MQLSAFDGDKTRKTRATAEEMAREAEQMEELSVFRAVSGLVAAAAGGGLVFALGAGGGGGRGERVGERARNGARLGRRRESGRGIERR